MTNVRAIDDAVRQVAANARAAIEAKAGRQFEQFEPLLVATQVVAGVNYFFKIQVSADSCIHARVFSGLDRSLSCHSVQLDKSKDEELKYF